MSEISYTALFAAFAAGTISFLSPCVLPLVPGYVSYIAGQSVLAKPTPNAASLRLQAIGLSFCFILGFTAVFVTLGASATALGQLLLAYRYELNLVGGTIVIGFGLFTLGLVRPQWLGRDFRLHLQLSNGRPLGAFLLGMAFAFGWSPCIGPMLGTILTMGVTSATVAKGIALLTTYSLGLGVPFLLAAAFTDGLLARLKSIGRAGRLCQLAAGAVMVIMGGAMVTGQLSAFSYWLLDTFPLLAAIG